MTTPFKLLLAFSFCLSAGMLAGHVGLYVWPAFKQAIFPQPALYVTSSETLKAKYNNALVRSLDWVSLLPAAEQEIITLYQSQEAQSEQDLTSQILRSLEASSDKNYQDALISTNTVESLEGQMVSISGFMVPIDFHDDKSVESLFFVPYFGACIHFPPPPPNQMLFAQLDKGLVEFDMTQPYTLFGEINRGLFEDPMGTSAYTLSVVSIIPFVGQPDDLRRH